MNYLSGIFRTYSKNSKGVLQKIVIVGLDIRSLTMRNRQVWDQRLGLITLMSPETWKTHMHSGTQHRDLFLSPLRYLARL